MSRSSSIDICSKYLWRPLGEGRCLSRISNRTVTTRKTAIQETRDDSEWAVFARAIATGERQANGAFDHKQV